ncbi:hypothetical protein E4T56_gene17182 [Termitomyces sp. T112]|nr:hypothetical protein E4T56_gene17182 [Termitomyces sp. T112]
MISLVLSRQSPRKGPAYNESLSVTVPSSNESILSVSCILVSQLQRAAGSESKMLYSPISIVTKRGQKSQSSGTRQYGRGNYLNISPVQRV